LLVTTDNVSDLQYYCNDTDTTATFKIALTKVYLRTPNYNYGINFCTSVHFLGSGTVKFKPYQILYIKQITLLYVLYT
jgi:hypothetical protein